MLIHVTQEDITNGRSREPRSCPVALALRRTCPSCDWHVGPDEICDDDTDREFPTTPMVFRFIEEFDNGGAPAVTPFSFELPLEATDAD